jgi:hypothetical protein
MLDGREAGSAGFRALCGFALCHWPCALRPAWQLAHNRQLLRQLATLANPKSCIVYADGPSPDFIVNDTKKELKIEQYG